VVNFRPDHASVTVVEASDSGITVKALGREVGAAETSLLLGR